MKQNHIKILERLRDLKLEQDDIYTNHLHDIKKVVKNREDFESCLVLEAVGFATMNETRIRITKQGMIFLEFK